jgi:uncharacterized protein with GYD domain
MVEAPDDEAAMALLLQTGALGNIRSETMRAMRADEITSVIERTS